MYLTNYTADKVTVAYTFIEHLRHNWRKLDDEAKDNLLKEISDLLNIQFSQQSFESKINAKNEQADKTTRRAKLGL